MKAKNYSCLNRHFFIIVLMFGLLNKNLVAQTTTYFNKEYENDTTSVGTVGTKAIDDGFLSVGIIGTSLENALFLKKLSLEGEIMWIELLDKGPEYRSTWLGSEFLKCNDDTYVFVHSKTKLPATEPRDRDVFFVRFDKEGNIIKKKLLEKEGQQRPRAVIQCNDDGFLIVGSAHLDGESSHVFAMKIDSNYTEQWYNTYKLSEEKHSKAFSVVPTTDGGYILSGFGYHPETDYDMYLVKIDSLGNEVLAKNIDGDGDGESAGRVCLNEKGKIILTGGMRINGILYAFIGELDDSLNLDWSEKYQKENFIHYSSNIFQTIDGNYITYAYHISDAGYSMHYLYKFNAEGDTIWTRSFKSDHINNDDYIRDLRPTPDGGFVAAGFVLSPSPQRSWVIKFDSLGRTCSYVGCDSVAWPVSTPLLDAPAPARCFVSPNPVVLGQPAYIHYHFPEEIPEVRFRLYDVRGVLVSEQRLSTLQNKAILDTENFVSGIYLWEVVLGGTVLESGKVFVE